MVGERTEVEKARLQIHVEEFKKINLSLNIQTGFKEGYDINRFTVPLQKDHSINYEEWNGVN